MAYFEDFENSFLGIENLSVLEFLNKINKALIKISEKIYQTNEDILFTYFGSSILNTFCAIKGDEGCLFLSDIDGIYFSNKKNLLIEAINSKRVNLNTDLFNNSIKVSVKTMSYDSSLYDEDLVFLSCLNNNFTQLKENHLVPLRFYKLKILDNINNKEISYEVLLLLWSIAKFIIKINCSQLSIIEAKYNLAKGLRKPNEIFHYNKNKGIFIITPNQLDNYIIKNMNKLEVFLLNISDSQYCVDLISKIKELIVNKNCKIDFPVYFKNECLNILLEYISRNQLNSRLPHYINEYLINEPYCNN